MSVGALEPMLVPPSVEPIDGVAFEMQMSVDGSHGASACAIKCAPIELAPIKQKIITILDNLEKRLMRLGCLDANQVTKILIYQRNYQQMMDAVA